MIVQAIESKKTLYWKSVATFLLLLLIWQLVASCHHLVLSFIWNLFHWQPPIPEWRFLSSPIDLLAALPSELTKGNIITDSIRTSIHTSIAFLISLILSLLISVLLFIFKDLREGCEPILKALSGVPPVTLLPIFALALGLDSSSIIALGIFGSTLSISLLLLDIFQGINPDLSKFIGKLGYSSLGTWLWKFSYVSENFYLAAREGLRWSLILVIVAEMQIGDISRGIGYYINSGRLNQSYELVYLGVLACGTVTLVLQSLLVISSKLTHLITKKILLRF